MILDCLIAIRNYKRGAKPWHEILAYETTKRVIIRDPALGLIRWLAILAMFVYLSIFRIYHNKAYMKTESITGIVQTSLQSPASLPVASQLDYCSDGAAGALSVLPCVTGPDAWVMAPSTGTADVFVATRVKDVSESAEVRSFVINPEAYTVGITFTVQALSLHHVSQNSMYSKSSSDLTTTLVDQEGVAYTNGIKRISRFDVISVSTLLHAAGISSLDDAHDADPSVSTRYDGMVLLLNIECPMDVTGTVNECEYKVRHMAESVGETFTVSSYDTSVKGGIPTQERRGISIKISISGSMGKFDLESLVLAWVASLALLEIITLCINWLMNYVLPFKGVYRMLMYEESPNIHELRSGCKKASKAIDRLRVERKSQAGQLSSPSGSPRLSAVPMPTAPSGKEQHGHGHAADLMVAQQRAMTAPKFQDPRSRSTSPHTPGSGGGGGGAAAAARPGTPPQQDFGRATSPMSAMALKQQPMQGSTAQGGYRQRAPGTISIEGESF